MDKITNAKTEFRLKQWTKIIQACQTSGMTVASWCEQNNVNVNHTTTGYVESVHWHERINLLRFKVKNSRLSPFLFRRQKYLQQLQFT